MKILASTLFFIVGTMIGSFLNCVIYRLSKKQGFLKGRSYCPHCKHSLRWQDLVPLLSFLFLKGKCRYCGKPISFRYPLVETGTGLIFALIIWERLPFLFSTSLIFWILDILFLSIVSCFLIVIFVYDLQYFIIPDKVIYPLIIIALGWQVVSNLFFEAYAKKSIIEAVYSGIGAALFFLIIVLASKGKGMGVGDVKLSFFMGIFLGFPSVLVALFSSFLLGAAVGMVLIITKKKHLKSEIPFAPFLVTGTALAFFYSGEIIEFYLNRAIF